MNNFILEKTVPIRLIAFNDANAVMEVLNFEFMFSMLTGSPSADPEDLKIAQRNQSISFSKAIAFLEGVVDNSMYITSDTPEELHTILLGGYDNNLILLPECAEIFLMNALHCKLTSIIHEDTVIDRVQLTDLDNKMSYTLVMDGEYDYEVLPPDSEWLGEFTLWDTAWWNRNDVSTFDRMFETQEERDKLLEKIDLDQLQMLNTSVLMEIEDSINDLLDESGDKPMPQGELVEVDFTKDKGGFTPKLV